ncbi:hypothetical protein Vadar_000479 [Vaccinium darrowii]|uniref:Uncharacterized protein n=1 Tax=Vaccinium darrowii TaxID=229202 RepID=A0ACB7X6L4_9ERIC|nr:hypothetical protein Vadar_000479 [Vaccinium darrowii]
MKTSYRLLWKPQNGRVKMVNPHDLNNRRIVATASTVEHSVNNTLECGRSCNAKAAAVVPKVLAMRLKVEGVKQGQGRGIHVDVNKEVEKKGFKNHTKVWAIVNALTRNGVKLILDDAEKEPVRQHGQRPVRLLVCYHLNFWTEPSFRPYQSFTLTGPIFGPFQSFTTEVWMEKWVKAVGPPLQAGTGLIVGPSFF